MKLKRYSYYNQKLGGRAQSYTMKIIKAGYIICHACDKKIELGDLCIGIRNKYTRNYHESCALVRHLVTMIEIREAQGVYDKKRELATV